MTVMEGTTKSDILHVCLKCGKTRGNHRAGTLQCLTGSKHRTFGYSSYSQDSTFVPDPKWKRPKDQFTL